MHLSFDVMSSVVTVLWFLAFVALCLWAWSPRRRKRFSAAAQLPLEQEADGPPEGSG